MGCTVSCCGDESDHKTASQQHAHQSSTLSQVDFESIPLFTFEGQTVTAKICHVHDGDTVTIGFDLLATLSTTNSNNKRHHYVKFNMRLLGLDAPEVKLKKTAPHRELEMKAGALVRDVLAQRIDTKLVKVHFRGKDKYGRLMGTITQRDGIDINAWLIEQKLAKPYAGKKKESWNVEELRDVVKRSQSLMS